ncbi:hypothetical protein PMAYCL1PPCAC_28381 [Pristionchus mayeri]|uniref:BPTI/Kunitz inhibitor domain-containing protein n=1 Tax=Pristionchus mayeri TaxID=1317129 RepID=A0AAN5ID29_9BILA|nr:hypothetical protein PMAYCL1PPCAC_28381 [Pristionchus mayeri]
MIRSVVALAVLLHFVRCCNDPREKGFSCDNVSSGMRFYHDKKSGRCQPFFFLGCGGNANNFAGREECEKSCTSTAKSSPELSRAGNGTSIVSACSLTTSAVLHDPAAECRTTSECAAGHSCSKVSCCPTKDHICSLTPSNGNEATEFVHRGRYAWIPSLKNCIRFSYFGVNGNANNFPSYKECVAFCGNQ